jgi:hypothetical protein
MSLINDRPLFENGNGLVLASLGYSHQSLRLPNLQSCKPGTSRGASNRVAA